MVVGVDLIEMELGTKICSHFIR